MSAKKTQSATAKEAVVTTSKQAAARPSKQPAAPTSKRAGAGKATGEETSVAEAAMEGAARVRSKQATADASKNEVPVPSTTAAAGAPKKATPGKPKEAPSTASKPAASEPAVTTPAVTTPAVTTPAVTTPAVTTPATTPGTWGEKLVLDFPTPGLAHVFQPPGLPLVARKPDQPATTSVLVRGGAGTGKTTLAVSVAHAIARAQGGLALYLTTEVDPSEVTHAAITLALGDGVSTPWSSASSASSANGATASPLPPGALRTAHLPATQAGERVDTTSERKHAAIRAVRELLAARAEGTRGAAPPGLPVRAVVIDAFGLPDPAGEDTDLTLRTALLSLVQSLEPQGISTVIVEETTPATPSALPFLTDVVFQLDLAPDPDTGELLRRLSCLKSRYKASFPGPHDQGLDGSGRPTVWPDILPDARHPLWPDVAPNAAPDATPNAASSAAPEPPLPLFIPSAGETYAMCPAGVVVLSPTDAEPSLLPAFEMTYGAHLARVDCGPATTITTGAATDLTVLPDRLGPFAIGWTLLRLHRAGRIHAAVFRYLDHFAARPRQSAATLRMLALLKAAGLPVCVQGPSDDLRRLLPVADLAPAKTASAALTQARPARPLQSAARWLSSWPRDGARPSPLGHLMLSMWMAGTSAETLAAAVQKAAAATGAAAPSDEDRLLACDLVGDGASATREIGRLLATSASQLTPAAFSALLVSCNPLDAARLLLARPEHRAKHAAHWPLLAALHTTSGGDAALQHLRERSLQGDPATTVCLLRALALRGHVHEALQHARTWTAESAPPPWFFARLHADLLLERQDPQATADAAQRLEVLKGDGLIPPLHRAEIAYNLGVARERLGDLPAARDAYRGALDFNPGHHLARAALGEVS
ncbi:hypothetical protein [Chondromyces apiculatus]|uniref:Uncharacterized protein n=1 Tax=Chondromyces apiculatus DSM 436 TaxID=1192034 RepID=A0A017TH69_9BACT|nr:hypothetical protein [Chondromyces apiculatus]EYF08564.1 Hypothetical protein CAP_4094 [Chondromyces apiculatus DSM 436]